MCRLYYGQGKVTSRPQIRPEFCTVSIGWLRAICALAATSPSIVELDFKGIWVLCAGDRGSA